MPRRRGRRVELKRDLLNRAGIVDSKNKDGSSAGGGRRTTARKGPKEALGFRRNGEFARDEGLEHPCALPSRCVRVYIEQVCDFCSDLGTVACFNQASEIARVGRRQGWVNGEHATTHPRRGRRGEASPPRMDRARTRS